MSAFKKIKKSYTTALPTPVRNAGLKPTQAPRPAITEVGAKSCCRVVMLRQDTARRGRCHLLTPQLERHRAVPWDQGAGAAKAVTPRTVSPSTPGIMRVFYSTPFGRRKRKAASFHHGCLRLKVRTPVNISFFATESAITKTIDLLLMYSKHSFPPPFLKSSLCHF